MRVRLQERIRARQHIRQKLAQLYSGTAEVDFTRVFHHIIWAGDFNFRLQAPQEVYSKSSISLCRLNGLLTCNMHISIHMREPQQPLSVLAILLGAAAETALLLLELQRRQRGLSSV